MGSYTQSEQGGRVYSIHSWTQEADIAISVGAASAEEGSSNQKQAAGAWQHVYFLHTVNIPAQDPEEGFALPLTLRLWGSLIHLC